LIDIPQEMLVDYKDEIDQRFAEKNLGKFRLIQERATNATVASIITQIEYMKSTGFFPDLICVDALNQIKGSEGRHFKDDNARFEAICEELRDLANDLNLPIVTACQTNRQGFDADFNDIQSIGKAIEIFQVADIVISFSQKDDMQETEEAIASLIKNRHGRKGLNLLVYYSPNKGVFVEKELLNLRALMSTKEKKRVTNVVAELRQKYTNK
jgi:replicative DNA helicase